MSEINLTDQNFNDEVIKSKELVLVDFYANWCGPCQMMMPVIEELVKEYKDKPVKIGKVNVDESKELAHQYNIMSIPTIILFKDGRVITQLIGGQSKDKLKEVVEKNL